MLEKECVVSINNLQNIESVRYSFDMPDAAC